MTPQKTLDDFFSRVAILHARLNEIDAAALDALAREAREMVDRSDEISGALRLEVAALRRQLILASDDEDRYEDITEAHNG